MRRRAALLPWVALAGAALVGLTTTPAGGQTATTTTEAPTTTIAPPGEVPPPSEGPGDGTSSRLLPVLVSPSTGLLDGQEIHVGGAGFTPGASLGIVLCTAASAEGGVRHCELSPYGSAVAAADGSFATTYRVRRIIYTEADGEVDCGSAPQACLVGVGNIADYDESGGAAIDFDPSVPPPPGPVLAVEPATGLLEGQRVTATGAGFPAGDSAFLAQCALEDGVVLQTTCEYDLYERLPDVAPDGTFSAPVTVHRRLYDGFQPVDCATTPCVLVAGRPIGPGRSTQAALGFDATVPPPPVPALTLEPGAALVDAQEVLVTGTGFRPGEQPYLEQCLPAPSSEQLDESCSSGVFDSDDGVRLPAVAGPDGRFTQRVVVERFLFEPSGEVDCAEAVGRCELRTGSYGDGTPARAALAFDASVPAPPPPALRADPGSGLTGRQVVALRGSGFRPAGYHVVVQCVAGAGLPDYEDCDERSMLPLPVGDDGAVDTSTRLRRSLRTGGGDVDCADAPGRCELRTGYPFDGGRPVGVPLTFDASLPRAPKASVTVSPSVDLVEGEEVTVSGTAMLPGRPVLVNQCPSVLPRDDAGPIGCSPYGYELIGEDVAGGEDLPVVDDDGTFSTSLRVARIIVGGQGDEFDCAGRGTCTVVAAQGERRPPVVPLAFDATVPPPPPPTLAVAPAAGLADGQTATVTGTGFAPGTEVYVAQCQAEGARFARCSRLAGVGLVDPSGALQGSVRVRREIGYDEDEVDCATVAGGCTLETGFGYDGTRHSAVPISFDPAAPPAPGPTLQVSPATGLAEGQEVSVTASGFSPGATVAVLGCTTLSADDLDLEHCDLSGPVIVEADDAGAVSTTYAVRSTIATAADGVTDCAAAGVSCSLAVISLFDDAERVGVALEFGGSASTARATQDVPMAAAGRPAGGPLAGGIPDAWLGAGGRALRRPVVDVRDAAP